MAEPKVKSWKVTKQQDYSNKTTGPNIVPTEAEFIIDFGRFTITATTDNCQIRSANELVKEANDLMSSYLKS